MMPFRQCLGAARIAPSTRGRNSHKNSGLANDKADLPRPVAHIRPDYVRPATRRRLDTSASTTPAATEAFNDSTPADIGMDTVSSHVSRTRRDSPLPSEPTTTTSGDVASDRSSTVTEPSASRPTIIRPSAAYWRSTLVRFVAIATGIFAAVPADVRHATAVMLADLRCGNSTPFAPNAAAERITAPRLRGSVTPSSATSSGGSVESWANLSRSSGWAYSNGGICSARPWCSAPPVRRSSSGLLTSSTEMPRSAASRTASVTRSSASTPSCTYSAVVGTIARRHSTTGLRPATSSAVGLSRAERRCCCCAAFTARFCAGWPGRIDARGVGPLPSRLFARCPPEPVTCPFFVPGLRMAPLRRELPATCSAVLQSPLWTVGGVLDGDARGQQAVAHRVGGREVTAGACGLPLLQLLGHQRVQRLLRAVVHRGRRPRQRVKAQHAQLRTYGRRRLQGGGGVLLQGGEALAHGVVHHRERRRRAQVVVQRRRELGAHRRPERHRAHARTDALHERLQSLVRPHRLVQCRHRELDGRPVVRGDQVVPQLLRPVLLDHRRDRHDVAQRLRHLLAGHPDDAVVHPEPRERVAGRT